MKLISGFTLSELLLVLGIMGVLVGITAAMSNTSLKNTEFDRVVDTVRGEIFAAQADTIAGTFDSEWGVAFFANSIVRYKGPNYLNRDPAFDLITEFSNQVILQNADEVAFTRPYGMPVTSVELSMFDGLRYATATVSHMGTIEIK
jgi:prepilin-type N-terminal cleavage/methylation domain-containing protein